jgi:hypothetical protein
MSDPGSVERNAQHAAIALERASQRNGGQNIPASPPESVTAATVPSRAVDNPRRAMDEGQSVPIEEIEKQVADTTHVANAPRTFGAELKPDANHNQSWSVADIFANARIGG